MSQAQDVPCPHDFTEREVAVADGHCPLCLAAALSSAHERIQALQGGAERYWEGRWRDADAELRAAPSASAPDGGEEPNYAAVIREFGGAYFCETHHTDEVGAALDQLVATRPPAIDGPSEDELSWILRRAFHGLPARMLEGGQEFWRNRAGLVLSQIANAAAPPAQGSAGWSRDRIREECTLYWNQAWKISNEQCATLAESLEYQYMGDLADAIRALAPPVEAQDSGARELADVIENHATWESAGFYELTLSKDQMTCVLRCLRAATPPVEAKGSERVREALSSLLNCVDGVHEPDQLERCKQNAKAALGDSSPATDT